MPKIFGKRLGLRRSKGSVGAEDTEEETANRTNEPDLSGSDDSDYAESSEPEVAAVPSLTELLEQDIDLTIQRLSDVDFQPDPLAGPHFSKMVSLFSSAYKRHGNILEAAIRKCVARDENFEVWTEPEFQVSQQAETFVAGVSLDTVDPIDRHFAYGNGDAGRLQIDILVWNKTEQSLRSYEVKRGHGRHDAGKIRSIKKEAYKTNVLLKSYGRAKGFRPAAVSSHVIFYYGNQSIPTPLGMSGNDLDAHFGIPIQAEVETVNRHFRTRLFEILADQ